MNCRTCEYPLWNLTARECPECGSPFAPSEEEFRPGTVRFRCPHCRQQYYGTDERGHLVPAAFTCVGCGVGITMDEMVLEPGEGQSEGSTRRHDLPWIRREVGGMWRRWWATTIGSMIRPSSLMAARNDASSLKAAWGYFMLTMGVATAGGLALMVGLMGLLWMVIALTAGSGGGGTPTPLATMGPMVFLQAMVFLAAMAVLLVWVVVWAASAHLVLRLSGPREGTIRSTFHAILYSGGTYALAAVPCLSNVAPIWWIVSAILMLRHAQGVSGWRASLAVLALPVLTVLAFVGGYAALIAMVISTAQQSASAVYAVDPKLPIVASAVQDRAAVQGGWDGRDHAVFLVLDGHLTPSDLVGTTTLTLTGDAPLGMGTLEDFDRAGPLERDAMVAAAALPAGVIAHRLGDFVFTYHGIDASNPPAGLWLVVLSPEPSANALAAGALHAAVADGGGTMTYRRVRPSELQDQNTIRAAHGLPALPDPATVTAGAPAISGGAAPPP